MGKSPTQAFVKFRGQNHFNIILPSVLGKVKVKFTIAQAMKAQRGRGIALLFL